MLSAMKPGNKFDAIVGNYIHIILGVRINEQNNAGSNIYPSVLHIIMHFSPHVCFSLATSKPGQNRL